VLWGGAAAAVIGAATAAALEAARKRKEEEEAQRQAAEAAAAQFNAAEKVIDAQIAANQDSQWLMQQWLGSQGLPTSYPTQAALVAAYDAAYDAEKKAKEQEALNDAYLRFKQADQQSMQEYEAYQEKLREADELKTEQQYIDYFASVKVDVAPGQLTLEQLRDMKAQYDGGISNSGIGQNPLLNLQQWQEWESLPKDQQKTDVCYVNENRNNQNSGLESNVFDILSQGAIGGIQANVASHLVFNPLDSGKIGIQVQGYPGSRPEYFEDLLEQTSIRFTGTRYNPETVENIVTKGLLEGAFSWETAGVSVITSLISNTIEYGLNSKDINQFFDNTFKNQKFWSSVISDSVINFVVGGLAALIAGVIFAAVGPEILSLAGAIAIAIGAGIGLSMLTNALGINDVFSTLIDNVITKITNTPQDSK
jgi:hypothetical protein